MKTLFVLSTILITICLTDCLAQLESQPRQCVLCLIIDLSPTDQWLQLQTVAENVYKYWSKSSSIGDTLLVFTVKGKTARLQFSCIKRGEDTEFDDFRSVLQTISPDWFIRSSLSAAIQGPIYKKINQHTGQQVDSVVIVLTDGNLSRQQASDVCKFAEEIETRHGWHLLITGTTEKTTRQILIAAGKGLIHWCKLADAADRAFLEKLIQKIRPSAPAAAEKVVADRRSGTTVEKLPASKKETFVEPNPVGKPPLKVQETRTVAQSTDTATKPPAGREERASAWKESSAKENTETNLPSESTAFEPKLIVAASKAQDVAPAEIAHAKSPKEPELSASAVGGEKQVKTVFSAPGQEAKTLLKENPKAPYPSRTSPFRSISTKLLAITGMSATCIVAVLLLSSWLYAKNWHKSAQNPVFEAQRQQENQPKILMARVGNSSYQLGNLSRFTAVHIGSSPENAIRISNKAVAPQHICIYRRRGKLFARNLSKTEIVANGQKVLPHKRCPLTLPSLISIDRDVGVNLFLAKAANSNSRNLQESKNGQ